MPRYEPSECPVGSTPISGVNANAGPSYSPLLLLILFHDRLSSYDPTRLEPTSSSLTDSSRNASPVHLDYLIFSYLLRYVHYDGRIGECARVGAGGLFDIAFGIGKITNDEENQEEGNTALNEARVSLAEQIFDGNAADVLAAGLGAVYSVLPFKVRLPTAEEANKIMDGGMHLGLNPDSRDDGSTQHHLRSFQDKDIQHQLDLITEICRFIDSIISKCRKAATDASKLDDRIKAIASALVDQVRTSLKLSFLDNVLYPSILECSIVDGSATAVVSYLRVILCSDPPASPRGELSTQVLAYLLGLEELGPVKLLVTKESRTRYGHLTARFTLKDLFMDAIASDASEAGIAALNLCSELLDRFCGLSTPGLLTCIDDEAATAFSQDLLVSSHKISAPVEGEYGRVNRVVLQTEDVESMDNLTNIASGLAITPDASPYKPSPSLVRDPDVELYSGLVLRLRGPRDDKESAAAQVYLTDAYASVCRHDCFQTGLSAVDMPHSIGSRGAIKSSRGRQMVGAYRLDPADVVLQELLNSLRHFFSHTAEFNVSLTGVLSSLAKCPCRSLRGWLLRLPKTESAADSTPRAPPQDVFTDSNPFQDDGEDRLPILYQTLRELTKQIAVYRSRVPDFNLLLTERRRGLLYVEGMEEALEVKLDVVRTQTVAPGWTPQREGVAMSDSSPPSLRRRTSNLSASLVSFLTPRKKASSGPTESISGSPFSFLTRHEQSAPATPFAAHYQRTTTLALEPLSAGEPISGMWTPDRNPPSHDRSISLTESISDSVGWNPRAADGSPRQVTLSQILDNCVVLEEFIKETIGHITARHTLGIDGRR